MLKAIIYDFDGTLTPNILPEFQIVEAGGLAGGAANPQFFEMAHEMSKNEQIDIYDAMMRVILLFARKSGLPLTNENLAMGANNRTFNAGVEDFLQRVQDQGVKNYLLSSGVKAYLERLSIAPMFTEILATTLEYDEKNEAVRPKLVMSTQQKAETLRTLARELNGDAENCEGMMYIGDGPTDIFALQFIKAHGGEAVLVYRDLGSAEVKEVREKAAANKFFPADYRAGSDLSKYVEQLVN